MDSEDIQQIIDQKSQRYDAYREQCKSVVLLIVIASEHDPRIDVPTSVLQQRYRSRFDATVILLDDIPQAFELAVERTVA